MTDAATIPTDSGGLQEETTVLGIPCYTLRTTTERPITVSEDTNRVLEAGPDALTLVQELFQSATRRAPRAPEGWDGHAADRAADAIVRHFSDVARRAREPLERIA